MFVKVVRWSDESGPAARTKSETIYECDSVSIHPYDDPVAQPVNMKEPGSVSVVMEGSSSYLPIEMFVVKDGTVEIYLMNNSGKTIDTWNWATRQERVKEVSLAIE